MNLYEWLLQFSRGTNKQEEKEEKEAEKEEKQAEKETITDIVQEVVVKPLKPGYVNAGNDV
jgi:hypothetical protein